MELRKLRCKLSVEERIAKGEEWAQTDARLKLAREEARAQVAQSREDMRLLEAHIEVLKHDYSTGTEHRDVEVREEIDAMAGVVRVFRQDNGALVESRPMTLAERQVELPALTKAGR